MPNNGTATQVATEKKLYRIGEVSRLLYDEGFTIAGARRFLREHEGNFEAESASERHAAEGAAQLLSRKMLLDLRDTLRAFLTLLERR